MIEDRIAVLRVRTPEGVAFSFPLASPVLRLAAWSVDQAAVSVSWSILAALLKVVGVFGDDFATGVVTVGYFVLSTGYAIVLEWQWGGQTLGKRLMHLRVMDEQGLPLQFSQVVVRNLLRPVDALPLAYLVGGLTALLNRKGQRLGDLAAATIVVYEPPPVGTGLGAIGASKYNSLRGQRHLMARLRNGTSPALAHAALQALWRRDELDAASRVELFAGLAAHFRTVGMLPPELAEGLADEQLVRNVVEVLFDVRGQPAPAAQAILS